MTSVVRWRCREATIAVGPPATWSVRTPFKGPCTCSATRGAGGPDRQLKPPQTAPRSTTSANRVAVSGSTIAVGAYDKKVGTNTGQGTAYVFSNAGQLDAERRAGRRRRRRG